jgi:FdhD protein
MTLVRASVEVPVTSWGARPHGDFPASLESDRDQLAVEVPLALVVNGISHVVMMGTPSDLEDFALGFVWTEGLLEALSDWRGVEVVPESEGEGWELRIEVSAACEWRLRERRRQLAGRTGCGICGLESLQALRTLWAPRTRPVTHPTASACVVSPQAVRAAALALPSHQTLHGATGAVHAAAWCSPSGQPEVVREDVGRHNALDKLIGALLLRRLAGQERGAASSPLLRPGFFLTTSRLSIEMVHKALSMGATHLAGISAPTSLAVAQAQQHGLALAGFVRSDRGVVYTQAEAWGVSEGGRA